MPKIKVEKTLMAILEEMQVRGHLIDKSLSPTPNGHFPAVSVEEWLEAHGCYIENKLKTLKEFNEERSRLYDGEHINRPRKNGIACPECGKELLDSDPRSTLASYPPKKIVHCECGYKGYRVA